MARVLIVGGGCRGEALARAVVADGHAVRMTSRDPGRVERIEATGAHAYVGDPARIGTLVYALDNVTLLCWLLGTATGSEETVAALHGPRLERMLEEIVDTTVRGVVYEAAGTVPSGVLAGGRAAVERAHEVNMIPVEVLDADPADEAGWLEAAHAAVGRLLAG